MSRAALKRVQYLIDGATHAPDAVVRVCFGDLRAVFALAKQAVNLRAILQRAAAGETVMEEEARNALRGSR